MSAGHYLKTLRANSMSGLCATMVVASNDAPDSVKMLADYVCDGTADQVEILAAIADLVSTGDGGTIELTEGTYVLAADVILNDNIAIVGRGAGSTILDGQTIKATSKSNVYVGYLQVKDAAATHGIEYTNVVSGIVEHCIVDNAADDGIAVIGSSTIGVRILHNICRNNSTSSVPSGIELDDGARNVEIIGNTLHDNGNVSTGYGGGISLHTHAAEPTIKNVMIESNLCYDNTTDVWIENPGANGVMIEKIIIEGNRLIDASVDSIRLDKIYNSLIVDNIIDNGRFTITATSLGIEVNNNIFRGEQLLLNGSNCSLIGNIITDVADGNHGVTVYGRTAIIGNTITDCARAGMRVDTGADGSIILNNIAMNNGQATTTHQTGIVVTHVDDVVVSANRCGDDQGVKTQKYGIYTSDSDYVHIVNNNVRGNSTSGVSEFDNANGRVESNIGHVTENAGTETIANGTTSIAVTHGLDVTPAIGDVMVTPIEAWGAMTEFYIDTYTSTQFTIHADQNPGQDVDFAWKAIVL